MNYAERNISLVGVSGMEYYGKIYEDKTGTTSLSGPAIVCLTHTRWEDNHWQHNMQAIYNDDAVHAYNHFKERGDISHIILVPADIEHKDIDAIDDLRRQYVHK